MRKTARKVTWIDPLGLQFIFNPLLFPIFSVFILTNLANLTNASMDITVVGLWWVASGHWYFASAHELSNIMCYLGYYG